MIAFTHTLFLYFLPLVLLPVLLMQLKHTNPKRIFFPSLELISEILIERKTVIKSRERMKRLLRMLIVLFVLLAFASPLYRHSPDKNKYMLIIDPTISMSVQPLRNIIQKLRGTYHITSIRFGKLPWESVASKKTLPFVYSDSDAGSLINRVLASKKASHILFLTDGQDYEFQKRWKKPTFVKSFDLILLRNGKNNLAVKSLSLMPSVAVVGQRVNILIRLNKKPKPDERMKITLNGKTILDAKAMYKTSLSRFIENKGINRLEVHLSGDDFKADNTYYEMIPAINNPSVFIGLDAPVLKYTVETILPGFNKLQSPQYADIKFETSGDGHGGIAFLFPENKDAYIESVRKTTGYLVKETSAIVNGRPESEYGVINKIGNISLKTSVILDFGKPLLTVNGTVLATRVGDNIYFAFNLEDNRAELESSVLLLFFINEVLNETWRTKFFGSGKPQGTLLDMNGQISDGRLPGIYKARDRIIVHNVHSESDFVFDSYREIKRKFYVGTGIKALPKKSRGLPSIAMFLMLLSLILLFLEQKY